MQNRVKQTFKTHTIVPWYLLRLYYHNFATLHNWTCENAFLNYWIWLVTKTTQWAKHEKYCSNAFDSNCAVPIDFTCFKILRPQCKNAIVFHVFFRFPTENMFAACMSIFHYVKGLMQEAYIICTYTYRSTKNTFKNRYTRHPILTLPISHL